MGDFVRAKRDATKPATLGLPDHGRRRSPGLRRVDLAARAGVSVEYLTHIEQGRDRHPSVAVVNVIADALSMDATERDHLRYLTKITGGSAPRTPGPAPRPARWGDSAMRTLRMLEPGIAVLTNRLGDILAHTTGFAALTVASGLLDAEEPNLTRYVFTDEQAFDLRLAPRLDHPEFGEPALDRETLDLTADAQQLVVFLPADEATASALGRP